MSSFVYFLTLIKIKSQVFSSFIFVLPKSKLGSYFLYPNPNLVFFSNLYFIVLGLFLRRLPYEHRGGITFIKLNFDIKLWLGYKFSLKPLNFH